MFDLHVISRGALSSFRKASNDGRNKKISPGARPGLDQFCDGVCLIQARFHRGDRFFDELGAFGAFRCGFEEFGCRSNGDIGRDHADILHRLLLGLADLLLGLPDAALQRLGELAARLMRIGFRLLARERHDGLRILLGLGALLPVFIEKRLSFLAQLLGFGQFLGDARRTVIEHRCNLRWHLQIDQQRHEEHEGDGNPGFRFSKHVQFPCALATALAASVLVTLVPMSWLTMSAAISVASSVTLASAFVRAAWMVFSAAAILPASSPSSLLRSLSTSAESFPRVSCAMACALLRASASAFSYSATALSVSVLKRCAEARSLSIWFLRPSMVPPVRGITSFETMK